MEALVSGCGGWCQAGPLSSSANTVMVEAWREFGLLMI
jgi:hypothetical protein